MEELMIRLSKLVGCGQVVCCVNFFPVILAMLLGDLM